MSEPEFPYDKHPRDAPAKKPITPPPPKVPPPPGQPPLPMPGIGGKSKFTCRICGKTFSSKAELTLHMETGHRSPKNKP